MNLRRTILATTAVVLALVVVWTGRDLWREGHRTGLRDALDTVPRSTLRLAFTDWSAVREQLDLPAKGTASARAIEELGTRGYESDLSAASSVDESTAALQEHFGFSPATAEWEAYAQSDAGAAMVMKMPDGFDLDTVTRHLDDLGFARPSDDDGVWKGGVDLVAAIDPTITPELQYVAVLADEHLIVTSDQEGYARTTTRVALGERESLADDGVTAGLVDKLDEPAAAMVWARDFACSDLAMSQADEDSQSQAEDLVSRAGKVTPLTGLAMTLSPDRTLTVAELFEDAGQARENLRARARLAVGEAPGRGGRFSDDLTLVSSRTDGAAVLLRLTPKDKSGFVLSALDNGPVLFATC